MLFCGLICGSSFAAFGWTNYGHVRDVRVFDSGACWFRIDGYSQLFWIDTNNAAGKTLLTVVMTAKASGKRINVYAKNNWDSSHSSWWKLTGVTQEPH
jgi:hypothetical protein